jgi:hypothetical protein
MERRQSLTRYTPADSGPGQVTALLAANVAHEFLSLIALSRKSGA